MIKHVTDMNVSIFYGHEWYKFYWHDSSYFLHTWILLHGTDKNVRKFYEHECYYMLLTWMH